MTSTISASALPAPTPSTAPATPVGTARRVFVRRLTELEPALEPDPPVASASVAPSPADPTSANPAPANREPTELAPTNPADDPAGQRGPRGEVSVVLRLVLEVLDRRRPASQLTSVLSPPVLRYLAAAIGRLDAPGSLRTGSSRAGQTGSPGLRSVRMCCPDDGVAEVSAVWRYRGRHRALAARFEYAPSPQRWQCTALRLG